MEIIYNSVIFLFIAIITYKLFLLSRKRYKKLPPGPPSLPLIGNLHQLKLPVFRTFDSLSQEHGPIFSFRFGSQSAIVVSSPSIAEECFTKNDIVLANRISTMKTKYLSYDNTMLVTASYGDHWRNLRRICSLEILSTHRINSFSGIRIDETVRLIRNLARASHAGYARVELKSPFTELTFNTIMRMVCGKRYYGDDESGRSEEARKFREVMDEMTKFGLGSGLGDFVPVLRWFDFGGDRKKIQSVAAKMDALFQGLIDEHRNKRQGSPNTMIDHLLSSQESQPEYYTDRIIKGLIMAMIVAGTETSAITLEWAMSNLLNNPEILEKARIELDTKIGQEKLLEEGDVSKLDYLQNIISETLRLYPAAPMLIPHLSSEDCNVGGFDVPRNTMVMVNAWAIHRDPDLWADPETFKPERFQNGEPRPYSLLPFGMGRRACPGSGLAQRTLGLTLGSLIQCFEWKRIGKEEIDMTEGHGTLMVKAIPLEVQCKARPIISKVFPEL